MPKIDGDKFTRAFQKACARAGKQPTREYRQHIHQQLHKKNRSYDIDKDDVNDNELEERLYELMS